MEAGDGHRVYWEVHGSGAPAVVLHGGPGSGCGPHWLESFDLTRHRVVLVDQRGCGRSTPLGELRANTTHHLLADLERLREHLGIERWLVLGGSWGSTLGLAYARRHPDRVRALVLFGVALSRPEDVEWATRGVARFLPAEWQRFSAFAGDAADLPAAYARLLADPATQERAAEEWCRWEDALAGPQPRFRDPGFRVRFARMVTHYWSHGCWLDPDELIGGVPGVPAVLVHGRRDLAAPLGVPYALAGGWPECELVVIEEEGHLGGAATAAAVRSAVARFAS